MWSPTSILAWKQLVNVDTNNSAFKAFYFHSLCQIGGHVSHNSSECSKIPSKITWPASWYTMKLPPVTLLVCLFQTEFSNHSTVQLHHSHKHRFQCLTSNMMMYSVETKMFRKGPFWHQSLMCLMQVLTIIFLWTSYHMTTLTMQNHKRTREMEHETLSCPVKHKPFWFKKSLGPLILSAFCCFRENVMWWFHPCTLCPCTWYHSCSQSFH